MEGGLQEATTSKPNKLKSWWSKRKTKQKETSQFQKDPVSSPAINGDAPPSYASSLAPINSVAACARGGEFATNATPKNTITTPRSDPSSKKHSFFPVRRSPPPPPIFKLSKDLLIYVADFLDYTSTICFKVSSRKFAATIPIPDQSPTIQDKLQILRLYPQTRRFRNDRSDPYQCAQCVMWHTFEYMVIYPQPYPESVFNSYSHFASQKPRYCTRFARLSGVWVAGEQIANDAEHIFCAVCHTPKSLRSNPCSWNCLRCQKCTDRMAWSSMCVRCWKAEDGLEMKYTGVVDPVSLKRRATEPLQGYEPGRGPNTYPRAPIVPACSIYDSPAYLGYPAYAAQTGAGAADPRGRVCGRCLGMLSYVPGSADMCRCGEDRHSFSDNR